MRLLKTLSLIGITAISASAFASLVPTLSPAALDFGTVSVGSTSSQNADIGGADNGDGNQAGNANNGTITSISIINSSGPGSFTAAQDCVGVRFSTSNPTQTCAVQVDCTPSAVGTMTADLRVELDLDNNTTPIPSAEIPLSCSGVAQPVPNAVAVPTMSVWGLGILTALIAGIAVVRRRLG